MKRSLLAVRLSAFVAPAWTALAALVAVAQIAPIAALMLASAGCAETTPSMVPETMPAAAAAPTTGAPAEDDRIVPPPPPGPRDLPRRVDGAGGKQAPPPLARPRDPGPPPAATRELAPPRPTVSALPGGMKLAVVERHDLPLVDVRLVLEAGNGDDPAGRAGLARLTASLLAQGTRTRSRAQIADQVETAGGDLAIDTTADTTTIAVHVLADQLDAALAVLADLARNPTFSAAAVDEEVHRGTEELEGAETRGALVAGRAAERLVFGPGPYGRLPTRTSLAAITRDDVTRFFASRYRPDGAELIVVGDVRAAEVAAKVKRAFGGWKATGAKPAAAAAAPDGASATATPTAPTTGGRVVHLIPVEPTAQARLVLAWPVAAPGDARSAAPLLVLSQAVDAALAHHRVTGYLERHRAASLFAVAMRVPRERAADTLRTLLALADSLGKGGLAEADVERARRRIGGSFLLAQDRPDGLAHLVELERSWGLPPDAWDGFGARLEKVTREELQAVAKQYLDPARATLVVVGDAGLALELATIGQVVELDAEGTPIKK